jgi:Ubiquitin family
VFVRTLMGEVITLNWEYSATIDQLKSIIEEVEGIPPVHQLLAFASKQLENGQ